MDNTQRWSRFVKLINFKLLAMVFVVLLAGCGTQGGGDDGTGTGTGAGTGTTGGTVTVPVVVNAIELSAASSSIATNQSTTVTVDLYDASGQLISDEQTATFTLDSPSLGVITSPVTVTNGTTTQVFTSRATEGSVTITATVGTATDQTTIQISNLTAADSVTVVPDPTSITVGGTSVVSATVLDDTGAAMPDGTLVNFSVDNAALGTIVASATTASGGAQATFKAGDTTAGTATITATSGSATSTGAIAVAGAAAGSIEILSATPQIGVIKGAGGQETSIVEFLVKDANGNPVIGSKTVQLTLSGPNGDEYIGSTPGVSTLNVGTVNGVATTTLHSGTIPGTATILATVVGNAALKTSSGVIAIGGGVPSAGHFSLSSTTLNLEGLAYDNLTADITALIADRYGNYNVLEGTAVSFYSECGAINRAANLSADGVGSVSFRTQTPDPENVTMSVIDDAIAANFLFYFGEVIGDSNNPRDGLCTIVAVVDGEEEFTDANANGVYDLSETYVDTYDDIHLEKDDDSMEIPFSLEVPGMPYDATFEDLIVDRNQDGFFDGRNNIWDSNKRISQPINLLITGVPGISVSHTSVTVTDPQGVAQATADAAQAAADADPTDAAKQAAADAAQAAADATPPSPVTVYFSIRDRNYNPPIAGTAFTVTIEGAGSDYAISFLDGDKKPFDGGKEYKLHIPANVPVNDFWAVTIYDTQTRSLLQTDPQFPTVGSQTEGFKQNEDGSFDVFFSPNPTPGFENNWLQTIPGKSFLVILRVYGPLKPWIEKTWRPGEVTLIE